MTEGGGFSGREGYTGYDPGVGGFYSKASGGVGFASPPPIIAAIRLREANAAAALKAQADAEASRVAQEQASQSQSVPVNTAGRPDIAPVAFQADQALRPMMGDAAIGSRPPTYQAQTGTQRVYSTKLPNPQDLKRAQDAIKIQQAAEEGRLQVSVKKQVIPTPTGSRTEEQTTYTITPRSSSTIEKATMFEGKSFIDALKGTISGKAAQAATERAFEADTRGDKLAFLGYTAGATAAGLAAAPYQTLKGSYETGEKIGSLLAKGKYVEAVALPSQAVLKPIGETIEFAKQGTPQTVFTVVTLGGGALLGGVVERGVGIAGKTIAPKIASAAVDLLPPKFAGESFVKITSVRPNVETPLGIVDYSKFDVTTNLQGKGILASGVKVSSTASGFAGSLQGSGEVAMIARGRTLGITTSGGKAIVKETPFQTMGVSKGSEEFTSFKSITRIGTEKVESIGTSQLLERGKEIQSISKIKGSTGKSRFDVIGIQLGEREPITSRVNIQPPAPREAVIGRLPMGFSKEAVIKVSSTGDIFAREPKTLFKSTPTEKLTPTKTGEVLIQKQVTRTEPITYEKQLYDKVYDSGIGAATKAGERIVIEKITGFVEKITGGGKAGLIIVSPKTLMKPSQPIFSEYVRSKTGSVQLTSPLSLSNIRDKTIQQPQSKQGSLISSALGGAFLSRTSTLTGTRTGTLDLTQTATQPQPGEFTATSLIKPPTYSLFVPFGSSGGQISGERGKITGGTGKGKRGKYGLFYSPFPIYQDILAFKGKGFGTPLSQKQQSKFFLAKPFAEIIPTKEFYNPKEVPLALGKVTKFKSRGIPTKLLKGNDKVTGGIRKLLGKKRQ